jgi:stage V sporulation protein R
LTDEEKKLFSYTLKECKEFGCDFYETIVEKLTYSEMSEVAAYGGFPVRYPHWKFGMEYEELAKGYEYGMSKIYEMVINTDPCRIYIQGNNTLVDNITVVAHATGHNHFFKNNIHFKHTSTGMMNKLADHGSRIRKYMRRWGRDRVTEFIDHVLRIQTLIDLTKAWDQREVEDIVFRDHREYEFPRRFPVSSDRLYMDPWINDSKFREYENKRIDKSEREKELGIFSRPEKDIMRFVRDHAPLKLWQQDIMAMLLEEALYFAPQRSTKILNEGFASWIDYWIMACKGLVGLGQKSHDCGIIHYAIHKAGVLGSKYSMNPYKLGFYLLLDIEDRWNKGKFGKEWEECKDVREREKWDKNLGLGKQKVFEVAKYYEFFDWKRFPNGEYKIISRDAKVIKRKLVQRYSNGGLPDIRLADPNHRGRGWMLLQHMFDGRPLYEPYAREVMGSLYYLWGKEICLATKDENGEECVLYCNGTNPDKDVILLTRDEYERRWI